MDGGSIEEWQERERTFLGTIILILTQHGFAYNLNLTHILAEVDQEKFLTCNQFVEFTFLWTGRYIL